MVNSGSSAYEVLYAINRWPTWMWTNKEIVDLVEWLRSHNLEAEKIEKKRGFYGLDIYSKHDQKSVKMILIKSTRLTTSLFP